MPKILDTRTSLDQTIRIFDSFYSFDLIVNSNEYDVVHSYFIGVCATKNIANNFTAVLFRIAQETGIDALVLLDYITGASSTKLEMNKVICYYLNSFKSKTTLYGVGQIPRPNQPVARNIVQ
jgi:hypothetical protein